MFVYSYGEDFLLKTYLGEYPEVAIDAIKRAMLTCVTMLTTDLPIPQVEAEQTLQTILGFTRDLMYAEFIDYRQLTKIQNMLNEKDLNNANPSL